MYTQIAADWNCTPKIHMFKHQTPNLMAFEDEAFGK